MKLGIILLLITHTVFAANGRSDYQTKRYIIPADNDVMESYNILETETPIYPMDFKVLVWNMYKGAKVSWEKDFTDLIHDKDILVLQEVYASKKMEDTLAKNKAFNYQFATSFMDKKDNKRRSGVATASRSYSLQTIWQRSYYREPVIKTPKMTLFTTYKLAGIDETLLVGNIHAINFVSHDKFQHMIKEAAKVMAKHDGPGIFAGDFNTWTKAKLATMKAIMTKLGYTYVTFSIDKRKKFLGNILDHVWVKDLSIQAAESKSYSGSDHNPMEVELSI